VEASLIKHFGFITKRRLGSQEIKSFLSFALEFDSGKESTSMLSSFLLSPMITVLSLKTICGLFIKVRYCCR
jgi:hypothetical protein